MARRLAWLLSGAAVALGLGHLSVTFVLFDALSLDALWFAGSGLAISLGGLVNMVALPASYGRAWNVPLAIANIAMTAFVLLIARLAPEPQVILGLILFAGLTILGGTRRAQAG